MHGCAPRRPSHRALSRHTAPANALPHGCPHPPTHPPPLAAGAFPLWLAPVQCRLMPVNDSVLPYVSDVAKAMREAGVRVEVAGGECACSALRVVMGIGVEVCVGGGWGGWGCLVVLVQVTLWG